MPENNCNIYTSVSVSIKKYRIPLIKKKALRNFNTSRDDIIDAIQYIYKNNSYPIENILDYIQRFCDVEITKEQISEYVVDKANIKDNPYVELETKTKNVKKSIDESKGFYIYGCGVWARKIYWNLCRDNSNFKGFLILTLSICITSKPYSCLCPNFSMSDIKKPLKLLLSLHRYSFRC